MKALWKNTVLAESDKTVLVERNHYFPPESVKIQFLKKSGNTYDCPWKGHAEYYHVKVDEDINEDAAWSYPDPKEAAHNIKGHFAFWKGVEINS